MTARPGSPEPAPADSGGVPWSGRDLPLGPFADDDGRPDPDLVEALARLGPEPDAAAEVAVVAALGRARVFVAIVAPPGETAELALMTATTPDGRRALPVFTSPASLARWHAAARPVPVEGRRAALSAVAEGCDLVDLDPAGPAPYRVRRPALWCVGQDRAWTPAYADPVVAEEISRLCTAAGTPGRPERGDQAEVRVVLSVPPGLTRADLDAITARVSARLGDSQVVADRVDSLQLTLRPSAS